MQNVGWVCEADLDELLADEIMAPVMDRAGVDADGLRTILADVARRREDGEGEED